MVPRVPSDDLMYDVTRRRTAVIGHKRVGLLAACSYRRRTLSDAPQLLHCSGSVALVVSPGCGGCVGVNSLSET